MLDARPAVVGDYACPRHREVTVQEGSFDLDSCRSFGCPGCTRGTPARPAREISWEISGTSVATGIVKNVGFAGDGEWARLDSNQGPTDYEFAPHYALGTFA